MLPIRPATRARIARPRALRRALRRAPTPTAKRPRVLLAPPGRGTASHLGRLLRAAANKHAGAVSGAGARRARRPSFHSPLELSSPVLADRLSIVEYKLR